LKFGMEKSITESVHIRRPGWKKKRKRDQGGGKKGALKEEIQKGSGKSCKKIVIWTGIGEGVRRDL